MLYIYIYIYIYYGFIGDMDIVHGQCFWKSISIIHEGY